MSGYEVPPPTNTDYFNTLFYYNSQGTAGGTVDPTTLLSYPTAQGLEYFPAGVDMGNTITFSNPSSSKNVIQNVGRLYFSGGSMQTVAYVSTAVGQLSTANSWAGINTFNQAPSIPFGLTFTGGPQTVPYQANLVGQLSATNTWASTNQFTAGLKFSSTGATQTVPYDATLVGQLSATNTWSQVNTFNAGIKFSDGTTQTTAPTNPASLLSSNNTWSGTNSFTQIPSTTVVTAPTNQQFVTFAYGNSIYPRLLTNNSYSGLNTFDRIAATTCTCTSFVSDTLNCTTGITTLNLTATDTTLSTTLTLNGTTFYGNSGFNNYYSQSGYKGEPTVYWTAPNTATAGKFVWSWPYQGNFVYMDGGGINYIQNGNPNASFLMDANDVTIRGTSWNSTVATLNYIKTYLFKNQIIPPP